MAYGLRHGARSYLWHLGLIGLVISLLWAGISFNLWHDYTLAEQHADSDATNLVRAFEENITRSVEAVDQTFLFLRYAYQHDPAGFTGARSPWQDRARQQMLVLVWPFILGVDGVPIPLAALLR